MSTETIMKKISLGRKQDNCLSFAIDLSLSLSVSLSLPLSLSLSLPPSLSSRRSASSHHDSERTLLFFLFFFICFAPLKAATSFAEGLLHGCGNPSALTSCFHVQVALQACELRLRDGPRTVIIRLTKEKRETVWQRACIFRTFGTVQCVTAVRPDMFGASEEAE